MKILKLVETLFLSCAIVGIISTSCFSAVKDTSESTVAFDAESIQPPQLLNPGFSQIDIPSVIFNDGNGYSGVTSQFTVPTAGVYQFNTNVSLDTGGQDCSAFILSLFLNGNELRRLSRTEWGHQFELSGSTLVSLASGDVIDVRIFHNCPNQVVVEGNGGAYFNGAMLNAK